MNSVLELEDEITKLKHHKNKNELSEYGCGMLTAYLKCMKLIKKLQKKTK